MKKAPNPAKDFINMVAPFPVCFKLDRGFITEYDILKTIILML